MSYLFKLTSSTDGSLRSNFLTFLNCFQKKNCQQKKTGIPIHRCQQHSYWDHSRHISVYLLPILQLHYSNKSNKKNCLNQNDNYSKRNRILIRVFSFTSGLDSPSSIFFSFSLFSSAAVSRTALFFLETAFAKKKSIRLFFLKKKKYINIYIYFLQIEANLF